jgi:hypothetical protein
MHPIQPPTPRRGRPPTGKSLSAAERMKRSRARRKAAGLRLETRWVSVTPAIPTFSAHRLIEARSLAMHALIARKITRDSSLLEIPRRNLARWRARSAEVAPAWLDEWQGILERPWPEIAACITEASENGARLRQSSPFAGVLTETERARIYEAFRA